MTRRLGKQSRRKEVAVSKSMTLWKKDSASSVLLVCTGMVPEFLDPLGTVYPTERFDRAAPISLGISPAKVDAEMID